RRIEFLDAAAGVDPYLVLVDLVEGFATWQCGADVVARAVLGDQVRIGTLDDPQQWQRLGQHRGRLGRVGDADILQPANVEHGARCQYLAQRFPVTEITTDVDASGADVAGVGGNAGQPQNFRHVAGDVVAGADLQHVRLP